MRHPIETLWREVGLPEYFLGNDGSNAKLYTLYDAILARSSERTDEARTKMAQESDAEFARLAGLIFDATKRAQAAEARLAEAVKALDPFEDYPDWSERKGNEMTGMRITYRQLRAAHAALRICVSGSTEAGK